MAWRGAAARRCARRAEATGPGRAPAALSGRAPTRRDDRASLIEGQQRSGGGHSTLAGGLLGPRAYRPSQRRPPGLALQLQAVQGGGEASKRPQLKARPVDRSAPRRERRREPPLAAALA